MDEAHKMLLFDPQTSGGLLMAIPRKTTIFEAEMSAPGQALSGRWAGLLR